jgi:hypothetical protein
MTATLDGGLTYNMGPLTITVSSCTKDSVEYTTTESTATQQSMVKDGTGKMTLTWTDFAFTLLNTACWDIEQVAFHFYNLNVTNADSYVYHDTDDTACVAC